MSADKDPVDNFLQLWNDVPQRHPKLKANVWRRIKEEPEPSNSKKAGGPLQNGMSFVFIFGCVLVGLAIAQFRLSLINEKWETQASHGYVSSVMPVPLADGLLP